MNETWIGADPTLVVERSTGSTATTPERAVGSREADAKIRLCRSSVIGALRALREEFPWLLAEFENAVQQQADLGELADIMRDIGLALQPSYPKAVAAMERALAGHPSVSKLLSTTTQLRKDVESERARRPGPVEVAGDGLGEARVPSSVSAAELVRCQGVLVGEHGVVTVVHSCHVQRPTVDVAALVAAAQDGTATSGATASPPTPAPTSTTAGTTTVPSGGNGVSIEGSRGVVVGDNVHMRNSIQHNFTKPCPLDAEKILDDSQVRDLAVEVARLREAAQADMSDDEGSQLIDATSDALAAAIEHRVRSLEPDIAAPELSGVGGDIRTRGGALVVKGGVGMAVGHDNDVRTEVRVRQLGQVRLIHCP